MSRACADNVCVGVQLVSNRNDPCFGNDTGGGENAAGSGGCGELVFVSTFTIGVIMRDWVPKAAYRWEGEWLAVDLYVQIHYYTE